MNELDANIVVDGQKSVSVVNMSGAIVKDGGAVDATCVIETAQGRQKVVKTYLMGGGGGGGGSAPTLTRKHYYVAGFSENNYITINYVPSNNGANVNSLHIEACGRLDEISLPKPNTLLGNSVVNISSPQIAYAGGSFWEVSIPTDSSTWADANVSYSVPFAAGQYSLVSLDWDANTLSGWYAIGGDDAISKTELAPGSASSLYWANPMLVGVDVGSGGYIANIWESVIDLARYKIVVNGETVFDGRTAIEGVDFTITGALTIKEVKELDIASLGQDA